MHRVHFTTRHLLYVVLIVAAVSALVRYASTTGPFQTLAVGILYDTVMCSFFMVWVCALPAGVHLARGDHLVTRFLGAVILLIFLAPFLLIVVGAMFLVAVKLFQIAC